MTKQERLLHMFAVAVLRNLLKLKDKLDREETSTIFTNYVIDSALDLQLVEYDEHTSYLKLKKTDEQKEP